MRNFILLAPEHPTEIVVGRTVAAVIGFKWEDYLQAEWYRGAKASSLIFETGLFFCPYEFRTVLKIEDITGGYTNNEV